MGLTAVIVQPWPLMTPLLQRGRHFLVIHTTTFFQRRLIRHEEYHPTPLLFMNPLLPTSLQLWRPSAFKILPCGFLDSVTLLSRMMRS